MSEPGGRANSQLADSGGESAPLAKAKAVDTFSDVGLRNPSNLRRLAIAACQLDRDFPAYEAASKIQGAFAEVFGSSMPVPRIEFDRELDYSGLFIFDDWTIKIRENTFEYYEFDDAIIPLIKNIGHELRHAEQAYMAARYSASIGAIRTDKRRYLHLPQLVVDFANEHPSERGTKEFDFGRAVLEDTIGPGTRERNESLYGPSGKIKQSRGTEEYGKAFNEFFEKLPKERDAAAVEQPLSKAIKDCLKG